jgi:hypothetical protein
MAKIRNEIYDENGLIEVQYIEVEETVTEDLITQKEKELLEIYEQIQNLKNGKTNN